MSSAPLLQHPSILNQGRRREEDRYRARRKLLTVTGICTVFMVVEAAGGYMAGSLALITDALHLLSDIVSNITGILALTLASRKGTIRLSYGYHRAEVIGAVASVLLIWSMTASLLFRAFHRVMSPPDVDGGIMSITAALGFLANILIAFVLRREPEKQKGADAALQEAGTCCGSKDKIKTATNDEDSSTEQNFQILPAALSGGVNIRAAYIHSLGDIMQNAGVLFGGLTIYFRPEWKVIDPFCTFLFSILVIKTSYGVFWDSMTVLMESAPADFNCRQLHKDLCEIPGIEQVHDMHVWSLTIGITAVTCHIIADSDSRTPKILDAANSLCQRRYGIEHITLQIEIRNRSNPCPFSNYSGSLATV